VDAGCAAYIGACSTDRQREDMEKDGRQHGGDLYNVLARLASFLCDWDISMSQCMTCGCKGGLGMLGGMQLDVVHMLSCVHLVARSRPTRLSIVDCAVVFPMKNLESVRAPTSKQGAHNDVKSMLDSSSLAFNAVSDRNSLACCCNNPKSQGCFSDGAPICLLGPLTARKERSRRSLMLLFSAYGKLFRS
jgi:hypothetical protein